MAWFSILMSADEYCRSKIDIDIFLNTYLVIYINVLYNSHIHLTGFTKNCMHIILYIIIYDN